MIPAGEAKQVTIVVDADHALPSVNTDASRVEQVLINLLTNAVKHTPPATTVRLTVAPSDGSILFEVTDEGPGWRKTNWSRSSTSM